MIERSMRAAAARKTLSQHHFTTTRVLALLGHDLFPTFRNGHGSYFCHSVVFGQFGKRFKSRSEAWMARLKR
jgi:hypothetical protein